MRVLFKDARTPMFKGVMFSFALACWLMSRLVASFAKSEIFAPQPFHSQLTGAGGLGSSQTFRNRGLESHGRDKMHINRLDSLCYMSHKSNKLLELTWLLKERPCCSYEDDGSAWLGICSQYYCLSLLSITQ